MPIMTLGRRSLTHSLDRYGDGARAVPDHDAQRREHIRVFGSGATRDSDGGKPDYEGFISPLVLQRFGQYMHQHRVQPDGQARDSDNWQKGIPLKEYMKSLIRHARDAWALHRGWPGDATQDIEEALCAVLFNDQGYLHEYLKAKARLSESNSTSEGSKGKGEDT